VSSAHFVNHFQHLVLPPLFPLLKAQFGIGFVELGLALTVASVVGVAAQLPVGYLVDRVGSRRMLVLGLLLAGVPISVSVWPRPIPRCCWRWCLSVLPTASFTRPITPSSRARLRRIALAARFRSIPSPDFSATPSLRSR